MQFVSTRTLELDPTVSWRLVAVRRKIALRREAPVAVPAVEFRPDRMPAVEAHAGARRRREWIRPGFGDTIEFAMFAATLAAIGLLELQFALLP